MSSFQETYTLAEAGLMRLEHIYRTRNGEINVRQTLEAIPFQPDWSALDLGCGTGHFTRRIAERLGQGEIVGVDSDPAVLALAEQLARQEQVGNARFQTGNALSLSFADSTFDLVFLHLLLLHFREPKIVLQECCRVLKPGGRLVVCDIDGFMSTWYPADPVMDELQRFFDFLEQKAGIDRFLGRKLYSTLRELGLQDVECRIVTDLYCGVVEQPHLDNIRALMANWLPLLDGFFGPGATPNFVERLLAYLEREDTVTYNNEFIVQGRVVKGSAVAG